LNSEERLASIFAALEAVNLSCLVMGGHAVRYYGFERYTNDFDLTLAPEAWDDLSGRLGRSALFSGAGLIEGPSWRPDAFRRFLVGRRADGQEEWLEFWRENHLLAPFAELFSRREVATYGGRKLAFLGLTDLIRSKETERARDWDDIAYLEEIQDARLHAQLGSGAITLVDALVQIRSRRGFDTYLAENRYHDTAAVQTALEKSTNPITQALLLPFVPNARVTSTVVPMEAIVEQKLRAISPASPLHRALVEVVRRRYKVVCQERDRADKEAIRTGPRGG
jgi:hypothetical protein